MHLLATERPGNNRSSYFSSKNHCPHIKHITCLFSPDEMVFDFLTHLLLSSAGEGKHGSPGEIHAASSFLAFLTYTSLNMGSWAHNCPAAALGFFSEVKQLISQVVSRWAELQQARVNPFFFAQSNGFPTHGSARELIHKLTLVPKRNQSAKSVEQNLKVVWL